MRERTDIHSPANFDPAKYKYVGMFYQGNSNSEASEVMYEMLQSELDTFFDADGYDGNYLMDLLEKSNFNGNYKNHRSCDHCGAHFMYGAVFQHENSDLIAVGHQCSFNAFGHNSRLEYDMKRLQNRVQAAREARKAKELADAFLADKPGLAGALNTNHGIVQDIKAKLFQYGSISDKQIALVLKLAAQVKDQEASKAAEDALPKSPVVEGRITIKGKILGFKETTKPMYHYNDSCIAWKMLVRDDRGFKVYGTMPMAISMDDKGKDVEFVATVQKGNQDEFFGFFKRPSKIKVLQVEQQ